MTEDAFARRFYADRAELDALGIHLTVDKPADGFSEQENYSLAPEAFHLPAIEFTDDERAALNTAFTLLDGEFAYAEPLRLALQQITWGRPSPLGSNLQQTIGLGITASAGGAEVSARLAKIDTAIYRRKRIEFEYYTMQSDATALRKVDPYHLLFEGGQFYLVGYSHEREDVRVFRLSRIRGKVAYATKAEHDFQRPVRLRPAPVRRPHPVAARRPGRHRRGLGLRRRLVVRRAPVRRLRRAERQRLPHRLRGAAAADLVGARPAAARPRRGPARAGRGGARADRPDRRAAPRRAAGADRGAARRRGRERRQRARPRRRGHDPPGALRPPRHARLGADRRRPPGPPAAGRRGLRASSRCRRRSCARTSRCSTSSTSAAAPT